MKKLYYLSISCFGDTDMGFLYHLAKTFDITYGVLFIDDVSNFSKTELANYCKKYNIKFEPYFFTRRQRDIRIAFEFIKVLKNIKKANPDIIYTFSFDNPIFSIIGLSLNKKKTIIFIHDVEFHSSYPFSYFFKIGRKITIFHFSFFQVFSKNQEAIFRKRYPKKKVYTISKTTSDYGNVKCYKKDLGYGTKKIRFLFFGKILIYKGLDQLIRAMNRLSYKYSNFELVIAGRCDNWETAYEPLIENKNIIIKRIGRIENVEIPDLFKSCDYLVLPYKDATQSGPLMIAYNYNLPVIASNIEAFREVIEEGTSGYFFDRSDPKGLESVLEAAIHQSRDEYELLVDKLK